MGKVNIKPVGDRAVLLEFGDQINEEINRMVMQAAGRIGRPVLRSAGNGSGICIAADLL